ncbi:MAG: flagellar basal body rod protein FlgB [Syntrophus sp. (in: bacteria)]|nr:flagellar basal body rod protein FlgB [Syntrophus sp. (in: bacteria)]
MNTVAPQTKPSELVYALHHLFREGGGMEKLFNQMINNLAGMIDVRAQQHRVILSNVANLDTPGFKASELNFDNELRSAKNVGMARTNPRHLTGKKESAGSVSYDIKESNDPVKLDTEMAKLSENQLLYNATVDILARKFRGIETTLREAK